MLKHGSKNNGVNWVEESMTLVGPLPSPPLLSRAGFSVQKLFIRILTFPRWVVGLSMIWDHALTLVPLQALVMAIEGLKNICVLVLLLEY